MTSTHPLSPIESTGEGAGALVPPGINRENITVIVETSFMKPSGDHGTPMFSRVGRQTAVETLEFHGEPAVQCESSFAKERRTQALNEHQKQKDADEEFGTKDFKQHQRLQRS